MQTSKSVWRAAWAAVAAVVVLCAASAAAGEDDVGSARPVGRSEGAQDHCTAKDYATDDFYDLTPLSKLSGNWQVQTSQYMYLINICRSLNKQEVRINNGTIKECVAGDEVCQIDLVHADQPTRSLGNYNGPVIPLVLGRGSLSLNFTGGDFCPNKQVYRRSSIVFTCDKSAGVGNPTFVSEDSSCGYTFAWRTSAACPQEDTVEPTLPTPTACEVVDVEKALRYDLTALSRPRGSWLVPTDEYLFAINVCEPVQGISQCGTTAGACQLKPGDPAFAKNLGISATTPELSVDTLVLHYLNGDKCHDGAFSRSTTVFFECDDTGALGSPKFVQETDDCEYIFEWTTAAACPEKLSSPCTLTVGGDQYSLQGLQRTAATGGVNYRVSHSAEYETHPHDIAMNVCGKLLATDTHCRDGVALCEWESANPSQSRSLGSLPTLTLTSTGLLAVYEDGDMCDNGGRVTTVVNYVCDSSAGTGQPVLLAALHECEYVIEWRSSEACANATSTSSTTNVGLVVFLVILAILVAYFIVGFLYNRFVRGAKGAEQIPHYNLCQASYYYCMSCFHRPATDGGMPRQPERTTGAIQL